MAGLLFDENLSRRLVSLFTDAFPASVHVVDVGLARADDMTVWQYARTHELTIVSKDSDFNALSTPQGHRPKIVWLRIGNRSTDETAEILRHIDRITLSSSRRRRGF